MKFKKACKNQKEGTAELLDQLVECLFSVNI